jgi:hypothetical protein
MSDRAINRTVNVRTRDDTTAILLGVRRTISAFRMEIIQLSRFLKILANDEIMAGVAAGDMGSMMQLAIPGIGMMLAGISMVAGARITQQRAAIPVGQTTPGMFRGVQSTGTAIVHQGEIIGRPRMPSGPAGITSPSPQSSQGLTSGLPASVLINFNDAHLNDERDVQDIVNELGTTIYEQIARVKAS